MSDNPPPPITEWRSGSCSASLMTFMTTIAAVVGLLLLARGRKTP